MLILYRLNEDVRTTYPELTNKLSLTIPTIKPRVKKLIKIGSTHYIDIYLNSHSLSPGNFSIDAIQIEKANIEDLLTLLRSLGEI